jgi:hypothetical protein
VSSYVDFCEAERADDDRIDADHDIVARWREFIRHPDVLAAQRRERARIRSEKGIRWGGRPAAA